MAPVHSVQTPHESATFGMGCFWGAESLYGAKRGVLRATVGYAGGTYPNPVYRNLGDHTEVVDLDYDPEVTTYEELLRLFWNNHEYGLNTRMKRQYRSVILYHTPEQKRIAEESKIKQEKEIGPICTTIEPKTKFYPAESYHQKYRLQNHKELCKELGLNEKLLETSYVATKLNGYLVGAGNLSDFMVEVETMGLTPEQKKYCIRYAEKHQGQGLFC